MPIVNNTTDIFDLLIFEKEPVQVSETLDKNEVVVTEPIIELKPVIEEIKPVIEVPSKDTLQIPKVFEGDFMAEGISIVLVCAILYGLFQLVVMLIPLLVSLAFVGGIGYLGYLLL
jgi:hypothetical protein